MKRRFGKFHFTDHVRTWITILCLIAFSVACYYVGLNIILVIYPLSIALINLLSIIITFQEKYKIENNVITVNFFKTTKCIEIPPELTLVITQADIRPPLAVPNIYGYFTNKLKNQYAVTILKRIPTHLLLDMIHTNYINEYTASLLHLKVPGYYYLYSFVFEECFFAELISNMNCEVVITQEAQDFLNININEIQTYTF